MTFRLSPDIDLPASAPTSTAAFLGTRGSGKTYGAGVMIEEFLAARVQVIVIDPVGVWYGLRLGADGQARGFDIPVFGGIHGDVPLEPTAGELVARLAVEQRVSMVLDVSDFTEGQQRRFVNDFARHFFQLKKRSPGPTHLVFEEAHEFFPQVVDAAAAPMVGATKRLWKIGRNYGIGGSLISTRAAEINKNGLNLSDRVYTGRLTAPEDVKRIKDWASSNGVNAAQVAALPTLPKGQLIAWRDPGDGGAVVTTFRKKVTFDTSRTPEAGEARPALGLPSINLAEVRKAMAATIEEAAANDPKALREEVARLRREAGIWQGIDGKKLVEDRDRLHDKCMALEERLQSAERAEVQYANAFEVIRKIASDHPTGETNYVYHLPAATPEGALKNVMAGRLPWEPEESEKVKAAYKPSSRPEYARAPDASGLTKCPREILAALAARHPNPLTKVQLATLAGYAPSGGGFNNAMGELKGKGLIERDGDSFAITAAGLKVAPRGQAPRTADELVDFWCSKLTGRAKDMLRLLSRSRRPLTKDEIAKEVGMEASAGGFNNYLGTLRSNGLVQKTRGGFEAASSLVVR